MKKYIMPTIKVATIKTATILVGSDPTTNDEIGNKNVLSKGGSLFDLEED